jgi:hypothetical protein
VLLLDRRERLGKGITPLTGLLKSSVCFSHKATIFRRDITVSAVNLLKIQVCIKSEKNNRYFILGHTYYIYIYIYIHTHIYIYRMSQEERT